MTAQERSEMHGKLVAELIEADANERDACCKLDIMLRLYESVARAGRARTLRVKEGDPRGPVFCAEEGETESPLPSPADLAEAVKRCVGAKQRTDAARKAVKAAGIDLSRLCE